MRFGTCRGHRGQMGSALLGRWCAAGVVLLSLVLAIQEPNAAQAADLGTTASRMWECAEWTFENPSCHGNPFDVVATVTFSHAGSGRRHVTEMFYVGHGRWSFRFTGTATGRWSFATSSADADLDGHTGAVRVVPNRNPLIKGFLMHQGSKYAIQTGDDGHLEGYLLNVYMNQQDFAMQHRSEN